MIINHNCCVKLIPLVIFIIRWLLPVVFRAVVFKLLVWCVAEGYVSGLQDAAASCNPDT